MCVALSEEILNQAGEHNNLNLRPFASIASKILDMTAKAKASNPGLEAQELFDAFDVDAFMASSGPLGPEPPAAIAPPVGARVGSEGVEDGVELLCGADAGEVTAFSWAHLRRALVEGFAGGRELEAFRLARAPRDQRIPSAARRPRRRGRRRGRRTGRRRGLLP